jgi:hypothetical protein
MIEALLAAWEPHKTLSQPAVAFAKLWGSGGCGVWLSDEWGPPIPYFAVDHHDGNKNHGYLPEVHGWPERQQFLEAVNAASSPIESVGCEKAYFPLDEPLGGPTVRIGSYIDVIFTDPKFNEDPINVLRLASYLIPAVAECEKWWGDISFVVQRCKFIAGTSVPWGMMFQIKNVGRDEREARKFWGESLRRLGLAITSLPPNAGFTKQ